MNSRNLVGFAVAILTLVLASLVEAGEPYHYYSVAPCRVVDTRSLTPPAIDLHATTPRLFTIKGNCGVPNDAEAVALNVTVTQHNMTTTGSAWLHVYTAGSSVPSTSTINFKYTDTTLANETIVELSNTPTEDIAVRNGRQATGLYVNLILDVIGYYKK